MNLSITQQIIVLELGRRSLSRLYSFEPERLLIYLLSLSISLPVFL